MRKLLALFGGIAVLIGCAVEDAPKASHFEHDHEVAHHWPDDLADAAAKIRERLVPPELGDGHDDHHEGHVHQHDDEDVSQNPQDEIADIVIWVPEIAADTNLSEQDWNMLDNAARSLSADLSETGNELTKFNREQTLALCDLIEQVLPRIPDQLPTLRVSSP
jgi:hypothetical protein